MLPDMVVPIFPNTQCSSENRPPILPTSTFPLPNCFHWIENITKIRVQRRPHGELFDNSRSVRLNGRQHFALQRAFSDDYDRVVSSSASDSGDDNTSATEGYAPSRTRSHLVIPSYALHDPKVRQACSPLGPLVHHRPSPDPAARSYDSQMSSGSPLRSDDSSHRRIIHRLPTLSESSSNSSGISSQTDLDEKKQAIVEEISELNLLGWDPDPKFPLIPLVDLWLELEEHIPANGEIPSPVNWYKEEEQIVSLVSNELSIDSDSLDWCRALIYHDAQHHSGRACKTQRGCEHRRADRRLFRLTSWGPGCLLYTA